MPLPARQRTDSEDGDNESDDKNELRQELLHEFSEVKDSDAEEIEQLFGDVVDEVRDEEDKRKLPGNKEDKDRFMLFKPNHPVLEIPENSDNGEEPMSETEKAHMVSRVLRKYKHRWGIENGFKQIKSFRVRTTSMNTEYRFFNFLYACTLYNVWRLTDLLVKLELLAESEFEYKPLVTADPS